MKIKLTFTVITSLLFLSCSNNIYVKRNKIHPEYLKQINSLGQSKTGKIALIEGDGYKADKITIVDNSLTCINVNTSKYLNYPITEIKEISFTDRIVGAVYGFAIGIGVGVGAGMLQIDESSEMRGLGIAAYGVGAGLIGSVIGVALGSERKYTFVEDQ